MTAPVNDLKVGPVVLANGVDTIVLDFFVEDDALLEVTVSSQSAPLILNTDYTFAGEGTATGTVTLTTPANGTDSYSVRLVPTLGRTTDVQSRGDFRSRVWNDEMDRLWRAIQYLDNQLTGSAFLFTQDSNVAAALQSLTAAGRVGKILGFTGDGSGLALVTGASNLAVPGSSVDNELVRWSGAAAGEIQGSGVTIDDNADIAGLRNLALTGDITGLVNQTLSGTLTMTGTSHLALAVGTTAQRPGSPAAGHIRRNSTLGLLEYYDGSNWLAVPPMLASLFASMATGDVLYWDSNGRLTRLPIGTTDQVLRVASGLPSWDDESTGSQWTLAPNQSMNTQTAVDFASIPSGCNAVDVIFQDLSLDGTDDVLIQIGDSGGIEATGYDSVGGLGTGESTSTAGFVITIAAAARRVSGVMQLRRRTSNAWIAKFAGAENQNDNVPIYGGGEKSLSAELDRVRVTRDGSDTFDAGNVSIAYRID